MAVPLVIGTFILAGPIISFIAGSRGSEFTSSSTIIFLGRSITSVTCLKILIFSVGISFFSNLYSYLIVSLGRQKSMVLPMVGFASFNVLLNLILIPRISYLGASMATLSTELLVLIVFYFVSKNFRHLPVRLDSALKTLLAGAIMGAAIYYFNFLGLNLLLNVAAAAIIYSVLIFAFGVVQKGMIRQIIGREE
jgi:O-antigen/teichoic acid export membrane protein